MKRSLLSFRPGLATVLLGASLAAQSIDPSTPVPAVSSADAQSMRRVLTAGAAAWRAPIHTHPDDPAFGAYGWWAANRDYKASFHDGFVFYPYLGPAYPEHLPLRWTTVAVTAGGEPIADLRAAQQVPSDWRFEYRFDGVTEAYDVRDDGVEQTFIVSRRPDRAGDLVVEGRIQTRLAVTQPAGVARHGELVFADAQGTPIIRYGAAFAIDATGDRTQVATSLVGDIVRLTVPAAWIASATFPVTVDPLTSRVVLSSLAAAFSSTSIHREDESTVKNMALVASRQFTAADYDVLMLLGREDFSSMQIVFGDFSTEVSSLLPDVAFVGGADRWVVGFWRHSTSDNRVRAYFHDKGSLTFNGGTLAVNHNPTGEHASFLAVGGLSNPTTGTVALMAYRADPFYGNSTTSAIWAVGLDAAARQFTSQRQKVSRSNLDAESPDVNCQIGWGDNGWVVAYQGRTDLVDDYDIYLTRISTGIGWMGDAQIGPDNLGDKARPVVQGWDGRYLVAMLQDVTPETNGQYFGRNVYVERFDWSNTSSQPTGFGAKLTVSRPNQELARLGLGYDGVSRSHWCLLADYAGPRTLVRRLGFTGAVTESLDLEAGAAGRYHAAVTWNGIKHEFPIVYCTMEVGVPLAGQILRYPIGAWNLLYGNGCGPGTIGTDTQPYVGSQFYRVRLAAAPPGQPAVLLIGSGAVGTELRGIGAPNCFLNVSPILATLPLSTDGTGGATLTVALPDAPMLTGDVYWQFLYGWPARPHTFPMGFTSGMRTHIE